LIEIRSRLRRDLREKWRIARVLVATLAVNVKQSVREDVFHICGRRCALAPMCPRVQ
jgi:hypothetical protein